MMTDQEIIDVIQHHLHGGKVEWCVVGDSVWQPKTHPNWNFASFKYRKKPKPREAREVWVNSYPDDTLGVNASSTHRGAVQCLNTRPHPLGEGKPVLFREVLE